MMSKHSIAAVALAGLLATGVVGTAAAEDTDAAQDAHDKQIVSSLHVTLAQAIATAEQQTGGKAISADVTQQGGSARIQVEVAAAQGVKTVTVDGTTGQVVATQAGDVETND